MVTFLILFGIALITVSSLPPIIGVVLSRITPLFRDVKTLWYALFSTIVETFLGTLLFFAIADYLRLKPTYVLLLTLYAFMIATSDLPRLIQDQRNIHRARSPSGVERRDPRWPVTYNPRVYRNMDLAGLAGDAIGLASGILLQGPLSFR